MSDIPARTTLEAGGWGVEEEERLPCHEGNCNVSLLHRAWGLRRGSVVDPSDKLQLHPSCGLL